jgi:sec-independent protein translocase protein TatA
MTPPGGAQLLIILFIVLLLFGAKRLPDLAGALGESLKQLRRASEDEAPDDTGSRDGPAT